MATHSIYLLITRLNPTQRASFALFVPNEPSPVQASSPDSPSSNNSATTSITNTAFAASTPPSSLTPGTLILAEGTPMGGYALRFMRNHRPASVRGRAQQVPRVVQIGEIESKYVVDPLGSTKRRGGGPDGDQRPRGPWERVARICPAPGVSADFRAPVNETTNRRCQEWTMEFVAKLIQLKYLEPEALEIVRKQRDPPDHGIGLRKVVPGGGLDGRRAKMVRGGSGGSGSGSPSRNGRTSSEKQGEKWYKQSS